MGFEFYSHILNCAKKQWLTFFKTQINLYFNFPLCLATENIILSIPLNSLQGPVISDLNSVNSKFLPFEPFFSECHLHSGAHIALWLAQSLLICVQSWYYTLWNIPHILRCWSLSSGPVTAAEISTVPLL